MRNLVPFVQFKKREKYPCKSVTLSKVARFSLQLYCRVSAGSGKAGKAGRRADFGKWAGKTYTFRCPEAGKAGKKYTLDIKLA